MSHAGHVVERFRLRNARMAERLEREPLDAQQAIDAAHADLFGPYVAGERDLHGVRLLLATLAETARAFPVLEDMEKRRGTAFHEAGHATAAYLLGVRFTKVTIQAPPSGQWLGCVQLAQSHQTGGIRSDVERLDAERYCVVDWAGPIAEAEAGLHVEREVWDTHRDDVRRVLLEIRPALSDAALRSLAEYLEHRARGLVRDAWPAVTALAELLLTRTTLDGSEARATIAAALDGCPPIVIMPEAVHHNPEDIAQ